MKKPFALFLTISMSSALAPATMPSAEQLKQIKLPPGFSISVLASDVPNARQMALSPGGTLFIGTRTAGNVYAIPNVVSNLAQGKKTEKARTIATGLPMPNGVAFHQGSLYVADNSRILRFDDIEKKLDQPPKYRILRSDFPTDRHHGWKYIAIGPDGWLYVPVGAPCNICLEKNEIYASITRMTLDGKQREIFARGIRNTVGFDWDPQTKELWFTDNGGDNMGDDVPADELNHAPKAGAHFGFPFCHQGDLRDPEYGKKSDCGAQGPYVHPAWKLAPHTAALGMKFYNGVMFPANDKGRILIAEHGSWNRSKKTGYRVMMVPMSGSKPQGYEVFAEGWKQGEKVWGRPVDVLVLPDGSVLISDDEMGAIYRVTFTR
ncbi:MAG: sorbosone dehydrogenase family protein [Bdellovibrionaceae bacterium]|nr:sorbosone dehydrogenase family protein [Pseudobdellovibrionaceae bacterium]